MASTPLYIGGGLLLYGLYRLWKLIDLLRRRSASASWMLTAGEVYKREVKEYGASGFFGSPIGPK